MRTSNMIERMQGLLGRPPLQPDQALLISPCSSVHTFFMTYAIDLAFINKNWKIKKLVSSLMPFRMAYSPGTTMVVEMPVGTIEQLKLETGMTLLWEEKDAFGL
ncbi:MAG: DUF192 domain-containing protein [Proteobacteria bacterium]|nr:DUF192 domain-containing protein [Pseudomonadota bacterium]